MKKAMKFVFILSIIILLNEIYTQHPDHHQGKHITKIVEEKNFKIVIDIMDHSAHERMMKSMKVKMKENPKDEHHIMITLIDQSTGNMIDKAQVEGMIISSNLKKDLKFQEMKHANMIHYGTHIKLKNLEKYKLNFSIRRGDIIIQKNIEFEL